MSAVLSPLVTGLYYAALALGSFVLLCWFIILAAVTADTATEGRRLRRRRRENAARQAQVIDDALPQVFAHVPYGTLSAETEQWLKDGGRG